MRIIIKYHLIIFIYDNLKNSKKSLKDIKEYKIIENK